MIVHIGRQRRERAKRLDRGESKDHAMMEQVLVVVATIHTHPSGKSTYRMARHPVPLLTKVSGAGGHDHIPLFF